LNWVDPEWLLYAKFGLGHVVRAVQRGCRTSGESGYGEIEAVPEEVNGAAFAKITAAESLERGLCKTKGFESADA
jgi:hypothetical protein